jgi:hypothetical protein
MKNNIKAIMPYVIINTLIYSIIGAIIGKNMVSIYNTRKRIDNDSRAIKKFLKEMAKTCPNKMSINELEGRDDRKPIDPIPIYVYD